MIRRELAKDPKLATESWDRFLPQFRKRHLKTSEKTAKKNEKLEAKVEARKAAGVQGDEAAAKTEKPAKKVYTPFPPAQLPRKVDLQLESGEYFLKAEEKAARETERRKQKVRFPDSTMLLSCTPSDYRDSSSKRRRHRKDAPDEPKRLWRQTKKRCLQSMRNGSESGLRGEKRNRRSSKTQLRRRRRSQRRLRWKYHDFFVLCMYALRPFPSRAIRSPNNLNLSEW